MSASERDVLEALGCTIVTNYVPTADPFVMEADCSPEWPSDTEEELPQEPRYTGRDAEYKEMAVRFNMTVRVHIEQQLDGTDAFCFRRAALGTAATQLRIPRKWLHASRAEHERGSQTRSCTALSAISVINQGTGGRSQCQSGSGAHVQL